jgi:hypothetical protein
MRIVDVARTLVLPDFTFPSGGTLATLALFWESIELPVYPGSPDPPDGAQDLVDGLMNVGAIRIRELDLARTYGTAFAGADEAEAKQVAAAWARTSPDTTASTIELDIADAIVVARARRVAQVLRNHVEAAVDLAGNIWAAPLASSPFGFLASSLPDKSGELPVAEATVIHLAVSSATIDPATPLDKLLRFREQHKELAGRLRGALTDVAATVRSDLPMSAVIGQADAALKNRVEPALGALEAELKRNRVSFAWSNVLGLGGVLAVGPLPTAATIGAGTQFVARGIRYAFDRDALARDHPFGYLQTVRASFLPGGGNALDGSHLAPRVPLVDLDTLISRVYLAAFRASPRDGFMASMLGERSTDPAACRKYVGELMASVNSDKPASWWQQAAPLK